MKSGQTVFEYDSQADYFYIIIQGSVGINVPNPLLKSWRDRWLRYQEIKKWHKTDFEKRKTGVMGKNKKVKYMEEIIEKKLNHLIKHHLKRVSMKPIDHVKN